MALPYSEGRRGMTRFRLSDIPEPVRRSAAAPLIRILMESGLAFDAIMLTRAVESPSDTTYWVPTEAYERERAARKLWA